MKEENMEKEERIVRYSNGVEGIAIEAERLIDRRALELAGGDASGAFLIVGRVMLKLFRDYFRLALATGASQQQENESKGAP